jgi:hypothetical protein
LPRRIDSGRARRVLFGESATIEHHLAGTATSPASGSGFSAPVRSAFSRAISLSANPILDHENRGVQSTSEAFHEEEFLSASRYEHPIQLKVLKNI